MQGEMQRYAVKTLMLPERLEDLFGSFLGY